MRELLQQLRQGLVIPWRVLSGAAARDYDAKLAELDLAIAALEVLQADTAAIVAEFYMAPNQTESKQARDV